MPNKITDDEIVKALELCQLEDTTICESCPLGKFYPYCDDVISPATIDLINRQKAEIEKLQNSGIRAKSVDEWVSYCNGLRAEAVKEFAERLKEKAKSNEWNGTICGLDIDNLLEEMVGENE